MGFNFSEDEINAMYGMYQNALKEIQERTRNVAQAITVKAKELKYEPVIKLSEAAVEYYNGELKQAEAKAMSEWQESELSFNRIMEKMAAGDGAKSRSKELESRIAEDIQSMGTMDSSGISGIDTTNWRCEASDFEELKQMIAGYVSLLEEMQNQYANKIESKKEENEIYISIEPVVLQSVSIVAAGFREGIHESFSALAGEFEMRAAEVKGLGAGAAQAAVAKSQSFVSNGAAALKAKVKSVLD